MDIGISNGLPNRARECKVLLYNLSTDARGLAIKRYFRRNHIACKMVSPSEYSEMLGYLLGWPLFQKNTKGVRFANFTEEMMVMDGFSDKQLDALLQFFQQEQLAPIALKAVATQSNVAWDSIQLYTALSEEHRRLTGNGVTRK